MKKTICNSVMVLGMLGIVVYGASFVKRVDAGALSKPQIPDPMLLEAWTRLDQHHDPIQLWDGRALTGHDLAQYLLEHAIPVVWDTEQVCNSGACSLLYCASEICAYEDREPIYVSPAEAKDMQNLVATLAHEIFHRTQPFGPAPSTQFEEYWAFFVGAQISGASWPTFDGYDPLISGYPFVCLT
jgi:hypothetical protein